MDPAKRKELALLILDKGKKGGPSPEPMADDAEGDDEESGPDEGRVSAARDMLAAIKGGDATKLAKALNAFLEC